MRISGARQAASYLTATVVSRGIAFLSIPVLVAALTTEQYGVLGLIQSVIPLAVPVFTLGIGQLAVIAYNTHEPEPGRGTLLQAVFTWTLLIAALLVPIGVLGVDRLYAGWDTGLTTAATALVIVSILRVPLEGLGRAEHRVGQVAASRIAREGGLLLALVAAVSLGGLSLQTALICYALAELLAVCLLLRPNSSVNSLISLRSIRRGRELLALSVPLVPHALSLAAMVYIDRWFISWQLGVHAVAVYTLASQLGGVLSAVYSALNETASVRYLSAAAQGGVEAIRSVYSRLVWWYALVAVIAAVPILAAGSFYILRMAPPDYRAGIVPLAVILVGLVFHALYLAHVNILFAMKRTAVVAASSVIAALANICGNALLIPVYGINGAAISTALSYAILMALVAWWVQRLTGARMNGSDLMATLDDARVRIRGVVQRVMPR